MEAIRWKSTFILLVTTFCPCSNSNCLFSQIQQITVLMCLFRQSFLSPTISSTETLNQREAVVVVGFRFQVLHIHAEKHPSVDVFLHCKST